VPAPTAADPLASDLEVLAVDKRYGAFAAVQDLSFNVRQGSFFSILGPSGCGKTTLLRMIAGFIAPDRGELRIKGTSMLGVPPNRRPVNMVFQHLALFPMMSVGENIAYGLERRGVKSAAIRDKVADMLRRVGLPGSADKRIDQLSGGQKQRVAIARSLVLEPALLLLDEPLAALDATTRATTRRELRRQLDGYDGVRLLVTHDPLDAAALADRIVVVDGGRVVQEGTLDELAARPRSRYVADLVGINLLSGRATDGRVDVGGLVLTVADRVSGDVLVTIPPTAVALSLTHPEGVARNVWPATIDGIERLAGRARIQLRGPVAIVAEVTEAAATELAAAGGREIWVSVKATEIEVFPA
jgi:ABC-type Fe3+/spermidine/putrescine transport system ATPase subunit